MSNLIVHDFVQPEPRPVYSDLAIYQDMRFCPRCGGEQIFIQVFEIEAGRVGYCVGCGGERFIPFTRSVSEAA